MAYELTRPNDKGSLLFKGKRLKFDSESINRLPIGAKEILEKAGIIKQIKENVRKSKSKE